MDKDEFTFYMNQLADALDNILKEDFGHRLGFALFCFEFNRPGIANYVSNADRDDMIKAIKETLKRFEKGEVKPTLTPPEQ